MPAIVVVGSVDKRVSRSRRTLGPGGESAQSASMFDYARISANLSLATLVGLAFLALSSTITRVIDGDTVVLGTGEHARIAGVDTPELRGPPCGRQLARLATLRLRQAIAQGEVTVQRIGGREAYNRVLIAVKIRGEPILDGGMREGWARPADGHKLAAWCV
jgi:endonuclease YncB( thermonuclease family)